jgi:hypothetical protein
MAAAAIPRWLWHPTPGAKENDNQPTYCAASLLLKLGLVIVININLTIHCGASTSIVGCVLFFST